MKLHFFPWISHEIWCFTKIFLWTWQLHGENHRTLSFFHILSIQKNTFPWNPWKVQVHHSFSKRTYMFSCVGCETWMSSLIFFRNSNVILRFQMKNCVLIFREMDLHVTSPTRDHFFISRRACDNVSLHIFHFMVFFFKIAFASFILSKSCWSGLQWPEVKGQGSVLRKDFACVWHASHSHL